MRCDQASRKSPKRRRENPQNALWQGFFSVYGHRIVRGPSAATGPDALPTGFGPRPGCGPLPSGHPTGHTQGLILNGAAVANDGFMNRFFSFGSWGAIVLVAVGILCLSAQTHAHSRALGRAVLQLGPTGEGSFQIILTEEDVEEFFEVDLEVPADHQRMRMLSQNRFPHFIRILADDSKCRLQAPDAMPTASPRMRFTLPLQCPHVPEILQVDWGLSGIATFDLQVALTFQGPEGPPQQAALARNLTRARFRLRSPAPSQLLSTYWRLGWDHIGEGWDHLAFLLALLLQVTVFRQLLLWVTTFTLAHALTLTLSLYARVQVPPEIVEPAIAASIVLAALHAFWHHRRQNWRMGLAPDLEPSQNRLWSAQNLRVVLSIFAVGLIHGLGFSTLLKETLQAELLLSTSPVRQPDPGDLDLLGALFGFHAGIELGQLMWVACLYPVLRRLRGWSLAPRVWPLLLLGVMALGLWFFLSVWL